MIEDVGSGQLYVVEIRKAACTNRKVWVRFKARRLRLRRLGNSIPWFAVFAWLRKGGFRPVLRPRGRREGEMRGRRGGCRYRRKMAAVRLPRLRHDGHKQAETDEGKAGARQDKKRYADERYAQTKEASAKVEASFRHSCRARCACEGFLPNEAGGNGRLASILLDNVCLNCLCIARAHCGAFLCMSALWHKRRPSWTSRTFRHCGVTRAFPCRKQSSFVSS